jgi:hypothetical protein
MDFVKKFAGGNSNEQSAQQGSAQQVPTQQGQSGGQSGGFLGGIGNKLNSAAGGGPESEKNEDYLDKGKLTTLLLTSTLPVLIHQQVSTLSKRDSWVRALRTTSPPLSRPRTSKSPTSSASNGRPPLAPTSPSRTRRPSSRRKKTNSTISMRVYLLKAGARWKTDDTKIMTTNNPKATRVLFDATLIML